MRKKKDEQENAVDEEVISEYQYSDSYERENPFWQDGGYSGNWGGTSMWSD